MSKTPISILQEIMVQRKENLPDYYIEDCIDTPGVSFKCTVKVGSLKTVGYASTKKEAKQNSAKRALEILGYYKGTNNRASISQKEISILFNNPVKQTPLANYIGKLNELASTHGKPYAAYHDEPIPSANGIFSTQCKFLEFSSIGYGLKKKDSKQDAARNMLQIVKNKNISLIATAIENLQLEKSKNLETLSQEILQHYEKINAPNSNNNPLSAACLVIPNIKKTVFSLDDLRIELKKYGYKYQIETFQKEPCIMMMKIEDTNAVIMGKGESKEEALKDLLENAILMLDNGFSLNVVF